jgi:hypothetical protein
MLNDWFSGVQKNIKSGTASTGIVAPKTTATPKANNSTFAPSNYGVGAGVTAKGATNVIGKGTTVKPSDVASLISRTSGTSGGSGGGGTAAPSALTDLLKVPGIENIYNPILAQLEAQKTAANARYESNQANLKNIFGALSGLAAADQAKIKEQFTQSITAQQQALASRVAEQRTATAAGVEQAVETGGERGSGPAMGVNPIQVAAEEGISQANAYQTTWENLQRANQAQAVEDTRARGEGYNYQQVAALQGLQQSLEQRLMEIGGNTAKVQSDIAAAKFGQDTGIAQAKYAEALASRNAASSAAASSASAAARAAAAVPAVDKVRNSIGDQRFNALTNQLNTAYTRAWNAKNPATYTGSPKEPTVASVVAAWKAAGGNPALISQAKTIASTIYGK